MATTLSRILVALFTSVLLLGATAAAAAVGSDAVEPLQRVQYRVADDRPQEARRALQAAATALEEATVGAARDTRDADKRPRWLWVLAGLVGIGLMANGRTR